MNLNIFHKTTLALTDCTSELVDYFAGTKVIAYTAGDYIFIGSPWPFNTLYVKPSVVNAVSAVLSISLWDGTTWRATKRVLDGTATSGVPLAKAGTIQFLPDRNINAWMSCDTQRPDGTEWITGLVGVCLYDLYWARLSYSATLTTTMALAYMGHMFLTNDLALESEHPILSRTGVKTAVKSGKTDWEEQRYIATSLIIDDLVRKNIITSGNQLLDPVKLENATISKTAQLVYSIFGDDYADQTKAAKDEYDLRIKNPLLTIDRNDNAIPDKEELTTKEGRFSR
jgi:hypothetical protein